MPYIYRISSTGLRSLHKQHTHTVQIHIFSRVLEGSTGSLLFPQVGRSWCGQTAVRPRSGDHSSWQAVAAVLIVINKAITFAQIGILAEALGGVNVGNCGHACEARPCGDAECRPLRDRFTCRCRPGMPHPCPAPDDNTILDSSPSKPNAAARFERSVPSFSGSESYLHYNDADTMKRCVKFLRLIFTFFSK